MGLEAPMAAALLAGGLGAAGAATSYVQAKQKNRSIRRASDSARQAASVQQKQLGDQADVEAERAIRQSRAIRARALVNAAGSGFDVGSGDVGALLGAIGSDTELNVGIIRQNEQNSLDLVRSRLDAQLAELSAGKSNLFLSAFSGLLQGAQTGFSLTSGAQAAGWVKPANSV